MRTLYKSLMAGDGRAPTVPPPPAPRQRQPQRVPDYVPPTVADLARIEKGGGETVNMADAERCMQRMRRFDAEMQQP